MYSPADSECMIDCTFCGLIQTGSNYKAKGMLFCYSANKALLRFGAILSI